MSSVILNSPPSLTLPAEGREQAGNSGSYCAPVPYLLKTVEESRFKLTGGMTINRTGKTPCRLSRRLTGRSEPVAEDPAHARSIVAAGANPTCGKQNRVLLGSAPQIESAAGR